MVTISQRQPVERRDPCGRHRAAAGVLSGPRARPAPYQGARREASRGNPARFFVTTIGTAHRIDSAMAVTKIRFRAYKPVLASAGNHHVEPEQSAASKPRSHPGQGQGHPAGLGAGSLHWTNAFAMVLMIMSGWQIYNASPLFEFHLLQIDHARRLARRRAALALRGDVALDAQRPALSRAWSRHRPLPQEAAADHAGGRDRRHQGRADRQALA